MHGQRASARLLSRARNRRLNVRQLANRNWFAARISPGRMPGTPEMRGFARISNRVGAPPKANLQIFAFAWSNPGARGGIGYKKGDTLSAVWW